MQKNTLFMKDNNRLYYNLYFPDINNVKTKKAVHELNSLFNVV
jgi:hypothetical protein